MWVSLRRTFPFLIFSTLLGLFQSHALADGELDKSPPYHLNQNGATLDVITARRIIHFGDAVPSLPTGQRIAKLRALLDTYFSDHPKETVYTFTFGQYDELNDRMAALASCSRQWDFRSGKMKNPAGWLREMLNKEASYRELIPVFEAVGYRIEVASLESIALCASKEIDWSRVKRACQTLLPAEAKLPCGALIAYRLTRYRCCEII